MSLIIDLIYITRELTKLAYTVITSPFAIVAGLLMLGGMTAPDMA
ncbi:hypothetical protein MPL1_07408 [Methylophaga lonarensis MPL]|uniref:Uncharacterized protein n=1 Tax=Methylophaga lonarensis MPL TaxID=1286106 RepID=M7NW08_9GAMM|nr:hypothetical protein [Methylophaga lonarensis]EMR12958.1 hypothetical protein MPL1_07408 [Methylophaga lonarensis MPL]